ncbi:MAG: ferritin-like domain-containing protein [Chloroflexota bacterium]
MGTERLRSGSGGRRRGASRAVAFLAVVFAVALAGCGSSNTPRNSASEKAADAAVVNTLLASELTLLRADGASLRAARGPARALLGRLRGQNQAHVDALTKAMRGLGGEVEAEAGALEAEPPRDRREALLLAYEAENAALNDDVVAVTHLQTPAPRALAADIVANHAQHLVLLRQALGAPPAALVPAPFESGEEPPPGEGR